MKLILRVVPQQGTSLDALLHQSLGLDVWVTRSDHLVLRTDEQNVSVAREDVRLS